MENPSQMSIKHTTVIDAFQTTAMKPNNLNNNSMERFEMIISPTATKQEKLLEQRASREQSLRLPQVAHATSATSSFNPAMTDKNQLSSLIKYQHNAALTKRKFMAQSIDTRLQDLEEVNQLAQLANLKLSPRQPVITKFVSRNNQYKKSVLESVLQIKRDSRDSQLLKNSQLPSSFLQSP